MKHSSVIVMLVAMIAVVGCSHNVSQPNVPASEPEHKPAKHNDSSESEGFQKYCQGAADGSKYVWNKTTQAWEWATSDETKKTAGEYYDTTVNAASRAYDAAKRGYEAVSSDTKK